MLFKAWQFRNYQRCQMAVVTATLWQFFLKLMTVENWWPWKWPWAMQSHTNVWHPSNSRKASNSRDVGNSKDPSSNRDAIFRPRTPGGEGTISTAKTPATAGPVWKSYKSGRKWCQKYGCDCGSDKKNLVAVKGLQGSGNTETIIRDQRYRIDTDAGLTQVTTVKNADAGLIFWLDNVVQSHLWDL